ncbi:MAG: hypothetical protein G01um10145_598 [Microgenomates group bacterium Gr01-1014_5]|nr:MAG: hypothetical protein G01um10145_598 [Microgenomates group bacterium Gr01-1014_5]
MNFYTIGHVTEDIVPRSHVSGAVVYSAVAAMKLGFRAHIITKIPQKHPYVRQLEKMGIVVYPLPIRQSNIKKGLTSFKNFFSKDGNREQVVTDTQERITVEDLDFFPSFPDNSVILIASVVAEVEEALFPILEKLGYFTATPQGYFRKIQKSGKVKQIVWRKISSLSYSRITVFSEEDITINNSGFSRKLLLERLIMHSSVTVLTCGRNGSLVYKNTPKEPIRIKAFELSSNEPVNLSGAGDVYATAFIIHFLQYQDLKEAALFASLYASLKIAEKEKLGGIGASTVPSLLTIKKFICGNKSRIGNFLRSNNSKILRVPHFPS